MTTSTDEGRAFSPPDRRILGDVCECCRTQLQIDASGRMFLSYRTVPSSGPMLRDIVLAVSSDGGKTFARRSVNQDGWEVNACPVADLPLPLTPTDKSQSPGLLAPVNDPACTMPSQMTMVIPFRREVSWTMI